MRPNQRVTVELTDRDPPERYVSRIEAVEEDHLVLACPMRHGLPLSLPPGTSLRVTLFHAGGAHGFDTTVIARSGGRNPLIQVNRPERLEAMQRRQYFREPAVVKTLCSAAPDGPKQIEGVTRNIGGGGVCLRSKDLGVLRQILAQRGADDPLWLELHLPDHPVRALAALVWCHFDEQEGYADLALEFLDVAEPERERLIRYLFVLQRDALRKGV